MAKTMKAAVARAFGQSLTLEEVPIPAPGPGQVLIKVAATGVCHTDLYAVNGDWPVKPMLPFIPGHEGAGIVTAVGPGATGLKEGDQVGVAWLHDACGECEYCRTGWDSLCLAQHNTGYSVNGSFAEYVIGSAPYAARQAGLHGPCTDPLRGRHDVQGHQGNGGQTREWIAISGVGGLGQLAIQYAKAMGLHVAALDVTEGKFDLARASGAEVTMNARLPDAAAQIVRQTGGGAHGALVTAVSPAAFRQAIYMLRRRDTIALVGLPPGDFQTPIFDVVLGRITIRGSIVGGRQDLAEAVWFAAEGSVRAQIHQTTLEDINHVFCDLKAAKVDGRMVIAF